jgi:hypothetical protein
MVAVTSTPLHSGHASAPDRPKSCRLFRVHAPRQDDNHKCAGNTHSSNAVSSGGKPADFQAAKLNDWSDDSFLVLSSSLMPRNALPERDPLSPWVEINHLSEGSSMQNLLATASPTAKLEVLETTDFEDRLTLQVSLAHASSCLECDVATEVHNHSRNMRPSPDLRTACTSLAMTPPDLTDNPAAATSRENLSSRIKQARVLPTVDKKNPDACSTKIKALREESIQWAVRLQPSDVHASRQSEHQGTRDHGLAIQARCIGAAAPPAMRQTCSSSRELSVCPDFVHAPTSQGQAEAACLADTNPPNIFVPSMPSDTCPHNLQLLVA